MASLAAIQLDRAPRPGVCDLLRAPIVRLFSGKRCCKLRGMCGSGQCVALRMSRPAKLRQLANLWQASSLNGVPSVLGSHDMNDQAVPDDDEAEAVVFSLLIEALVADICRRRVVGAFHCRGQSLGRIRRAILAVKVYSESGSVLLVGSLS
jgi:hypothetical protein